MIPSDAPDGWFDILDGLFREIGSALRRTPGHKFEVIQVKEKLASLRVHFSLDQASDITADILGPSGHIQIVNEVDGPALMDEIRALVAEASRRSTQTCQKCGSPGTRRDKRGWLVVLCDQHFDK
jgi:hypothetical protein